jgi:uncharacterized membrane protein YgcG
MKNKGFVLGILAVLLTFGFLSVGCASIRGENIGSFPSISVPAKDFTSLGLVFTENVIENNTGKVFTYNALLKEAHALGADAIVNVTIDVQREGTKILMFSFGKEIWYGSATAIKYTSGILKDVTTNNTDSTTVTKEGIIMSGGGGGGGSSGGGGGGGTTSAGGGKKWYNPFTWFK